MNFDSSLKIKKNFFFSSKSFILRTLAKSNSIKKNLKNLKNLKILKDNTVISKVYCGGDNFEAALFDILKDKPLFYFTEHGYGNLRDGIIYSPKIKHKIHNLILKFLYKFGFINFYPIQYESYIGILSKNIKKKIFLNFNLVRSKINILNALSIISKMSAFIEARKKIKKKKNYKYVFFNVSSLIVSKDKKDFESLLIKISSIINKKNECLLIKNHPSWRSPQTEKCLNKMKKFFKKQKIKYSHLEDDFLEKLPAELIVCLLKLKKFFQTCLQYHSFVV